MSRKNRFDFFVLTVFFVDIAEICLVATLQFYCYSFIYWIFVYNFIEHPRSKLLKYILCILKVKEIYKFDTHIRINLMLRVNVAYRNSSLVIPKNVKL